MTIRSTRVALLAVSILFLALVPARADGVLVFGGTGRLGAEIVKQLVNASAKEITVFARPTSDRSRLDGLDVTFLTGDALNEADVEAAIKSNDFRVVINAMAVTPSNPNKNFYADGQINISKWAKETGVKRVILNSAVGAGDSSAAYPDRLRPMFGNILKDKEAAENDLLNSGLEYTIIRNYSIMPESTPITGTAYLTEDRMATGRIGRADLAILNVYCLDGYLCENKIFHAIAPD
jgi:uncharacterized protein YbjT (DUF2867 family)